MQDIPLCHEISSSKYCHGSGITGTVACSLRIHRDGVGQTVRTAHAPAVDNCACRAMLLVLSPHAPFAINHTILACCAARQTNNSCFLSMQILSGDCPCTTFFLLPFSTCGMSTSQSSTTIPPGSVSTVTAQVVHPPMTGGWSIPMSPHSPRCWQLPSSQNWDSITGSPPSSLR